MYDPSQRIANPDMQEGTSSEIGLDIVSELVRQSEIDFRDTEATHSRAPCKPNTSIHSTVARELSGGTGLGSVVGYVALGAKHGEITGDTEMVCLGGR